ncbi:MAG: hypothetical protein H6978_07150 [Gammaproteobacteria bacterium]|nr:hypothetical protein [Gammaproteobacteria bacterium]
MSTPAEQVLFLSTAYWASRALHVIAQSGVADVLADEPRTAAAMAAEIGADPLALHRLLRALASHGIFELNNGYFSHNECSRLLRSDVKDSMRARAVMDGLPVHWNAYGALGDSLRTGRPAVEGIIEEPNFFAYLGNHPDEASIFAGAMAGKSISQIREVLAACDFSSFNTIGDIGGSTGHLLHAILDAYPAAAGMLFELPEIIAEARNNPHPRISYVAGSFFTDAIPPCDAYLLMMVLHDWSDEESITILRNIRKNAPANAKVLLVEGIVDESVKDNYILDIDIEMMALTTGRERTEAEWTTVLEAAGFKLQRITRLAHWTGIIEAVST